MDISDHGALVVLSSGPGIGSHVAARFAREGFDKIILMSRNEARLKVDAVIVRTSSPNTDVDIVPVDLTMTGSVRRALIKVDRRLDGMRLECVVFNAARVTTSELLSWPMEELQRDLHVSLYPHTV
jgi:NAD(P)-dependent dehydrogenase (short-subunit alcohol dehydrogenase family)